MKVNKKLQPSKRYSVNYRRAVLIVVILPIKSNTSVQQFL